MVQIIIALVIAIVFYYIGLYKGMMKAKEIAKKTYRQFGIVLSKDLNKQTMAQQTEQIGDNNKTITAVEWLEKKVFPRINFSNVEERKAMRKFFTQAKEMEKEQITDAYIIGSYDMAAKEFRPEQYFNETYNK